VLSPAAANIASAKSHCRALSSARAAKRNQTVASEYAQHRSQTVARVQSRQRLDLMPPRLDRSYSVFDRNQIVDHEVMQATPRLNVQAEFGIRDLPRRLRTTVATAQTVRHATQPGGCPRGRVSPRPPEMLAARLMRREQPRDRVRACVGHQVEAEQRCEVTQLSAG
jgi:hypothetical protein